MTSKRNISRFRNDLCHIRMIHMDKILKAKAESVPEADIEKMALIFKVLGDPTRLKILLVLRGGEMCVCDLAAFTGLTESAVSHQLRRLKDMALVKKRRDGQILYYFLDDSHVDTLLNMALAHTQEK